MNSVLDSLNPSIHLKELLFVLEFLLECLQLLLKLLDLLMACWRVGVWVLLEVPKFHLKMLESLLQC